MARQVFEIGALYRRGFRNACFSLGLSVQEDAGLLDSVFRVEGTTQAVERLQRYVKTVQEFNALQDQLEAMAERDFLAQRRWYKPNTWFRP